MALVSSNAGLAGQSSSSEHNLTEGPFALADGPSGAVVELAPNASQRVALTFAPAEASGAAAQLQLSVT